METKRFHAILSEIKRIDANLQTTVKSFQLIGEQDQAFLAQFEPTLLDASYNMR